MPNYTTQRAKMAHRTPRAGVLRLRGAPRAGKALAKALPILEQVVIPDPRREREQLLLSTLKANRAEAVELASVKTQGGSVLEVDLADDFGLGEIFGGASSAHHQIAIHMRAHIQTLIVPEVLRRDGRRQARELIGAGQSGGTRNGLASTPVLGLKVLDHAGTAGYACTREAAVNLRHHNAGGTVVVQSQVITREQCTLGAQKDLHVEPEALPSLNNRDIELASFFNLRCGGQNAIITFKSASQPSEHPGVVGAVAHVGVEKNLRLLKNGAMPADEVDPPIQT